jgi:energy-coupling factor transport system permease protein
VVAAQIYCAKSLGWSIIVENRDAFSGCHPIVNFIYFTFVIGFSMVYMHPAALTASALCAFSYSVYLGGGKAARRGLTYMLPMLLFAALINPAFNHQGGTILSYLPSGNPLTLESILYGVAAAAMLVAVITWFGCFNQVMSSDKFIYLFGRVIPALSLIVSMSLRFAPLFSAHIRVISDAQKCLGRDMSQGSVLRKAKHGVHILSIMITWALENAIEIADSMKSRGYGLPGRTAFSIYRFDRRDRRALAFILLCGGYVLVGTALGGMYYRYFPTYRSNWDLYSVSIAMAYFALCAAPLIMNLREDWIWKKHIESTT